MEDYLEYIQKINAERKATKADVNFRREEASEGRKATKADANFRREEASEGRKATLADANFRREESSGGRKATLADAGFRREADPSDPISVMESATANAFSSKEEFVQALSGVSVLVSSAGSQYPLKRILSAEGGEAVICLCGSQSGEDVVAKVYTGLIHSGKDSSEARAAVLQYMKSEEGQKYVLPVDDIGVLELGGSNYYFEIMPYCAEGDLFQLGKPSFEMIVDIVRYLNEGIHSIHEAGILHRDIKPENIYRYKGRIVLGDFGVAKLAVNGASRATKTMVATDGYAAPEVRLGLTENPHFIYSTKCDYYSLGVTIASLYEGHFVYDGMSYEALYTAVVNGRIPLTRLDPHREELENLVFGLCRFDAKKRFGYEDVKKWLSNHQYSGDMVIDEWPKPFYLLGEEYRDEKSLFLGITRDKKHWDEGVQLLYSKFFEQFFISFRTDLARAAQLADEQYRESRQDMGLAVFLKTLYAPGPIVWKGYSFASLFELGDKMAVTKTPLGYAEILSNGCVSYWMEHTTGVTFDKETRQMVGEMEALVKTEPELSCYWFGNVFSKEKRVEICGRTATTVKDFFRAMFQKPSLFYKEDIVKKFLNPKMGATLYGFLFSYGYKEMIEKQWRAWKGKTEYDKACMLFSLLDNIAAKENADTAAVRDFFVNYGPVGGYVYAQRLIQSVPAIYLSMDASGEDILRRIREMQLDFKKDVQTVYREIMPLSDLIEKMRCVLNDNPFCITSGVYENSGILCTNLKGCFAFEIYGKYAPLGFEALINEVGGGKQGWN